MGTFKRLETTKYKKTTKGKYYILHYNRGIELSRKIAYMTKELELFFITNLRTNQTAFVFVIS